MLQLTCIVGDGRPAATIQWFRDDNEIKSGIETSSKSGNRIM